MSDTTKFSEFIRNASPEEKVRVYAKVMNEATEAQNNAGINSPHNACQFRENCRKAEAEIARLRDVLTSKGFVECGIPACNCGSWHHRYGLPERWAEIKEVLIDADVLNNDTGNMPLNAIKKLISQLAERDAEIARLLGENHG